MGRAYASDDFAQLAAWCRELTDAAAADVAGPGRRRMHNAFRASSRARARVLGERLELQGHFGAVLRHRDLIGQPLLVQALVQVGARLEAVVDRLEVDGDDAGVGRVPGDGDDVVGRSSRAGRRSRKCAPLALTATTSGRCSSSAARTSSHQIVSPAT